VSGLENGDLITASCSTSATQFSDVAAGGYPITATLSDPGNRLSNYTLVNAGNTLTVTPAVQTISWSNPAEITYGTPLGGTQLDATVAGVVGGAAPGSLSYTPAAGAVLSAGSQTLAVMAAATQDYSAATATATLVVDKALLTVTTNAETKVYGTANPTLSGTVSGLENGDLITASCSTSATQFSDVAAGGYPITATLSDPGNRLSNYTLVNAGNTLTVTPAVQTISWSNPAEITYGTPLGGTQLDATVAGVVGGAAPGSLSYTPAAGAVLSAGSQTLAVMAAATQDYSAATATATLVVDKALLTVTTNAETKVYGTANPTLSGTVSGLENGDLITASCSTSATQFSDVAAGGYPITATLSDPGNRLSNYTLVNAGNTLTITPAVQTISWSNPAEITYGTPLSGMQLEATVAGVSGGTAPGSLSYTPAAGAVLSAGSQTLAVTAVATQDYSAATATATLVVDKALLTVTTSAQTKVYGTANPTLSGTVSGLENGDLITASCSTSATQFSDVAAAGGYPITATLSDPGNRLSNYTVVNAGNTLTITPASQTISWSNPAEITYGTSLSGTQLDATVAGVNGGAVPGGLSYTPAAGAVLSAGSQTLAVTAVATQDYSAATTTATLVVDKALLTVTTSAQTKVYGTTNPTLTGSVSGLENSDLITASCSTSATQFSDVAVGGYPITATLSDPGNRLSNYTLVNAGNTLTITPAGLTVSGITAANKSYDGNTTATLLGLTTATLQGVFSGDTVTLGTAAASGGFSSKDVANGLTVTVSGLTIDGPQAGDYSLTQPTATANITARCITVGASPNAKIYDGTTSASAVPTVISGNLVAGDTATFSETYNNKDAGVGKTLTPSGTINDGDGGADYAVTFASTTVGGIYPCSITVTAATNTKAYDGTTSALATPAITSGSLAVGDTAAFSEGYDTPAVGTGKTLIPSGTVGDGNGGANYSVTFVTNTSGAITQTVDHFLVTASPANVTAGAEFILVVTAQDSSGNMVPGYAGTVHFTGSDPREPAPAANLTFAPGSGVAATLATLQTAGSWTITASDGTYTDGSTPVTVTAATASKVVFSQQPTGTTAGATISPAVTADVEDQYGNLVSSGSGSTANVTLAIASGPDGSTLLGNTTVAAVGGVATFSHLSIDQAGSYSLSAAGAGLGGTATSGSFSVTTGPAARLVFTTQPSNTPGADTMANVAVAVEDAYGDVVTSDNSSVTLSLNAAASGGGGVLHGTTAATAAGGVATFSGLSIVDLSNNGYSAAGTGYTLGASDGGLTLAKSTAFNTTLIVSSCTMTPTGFVATFSQPFMVATTPVAIGPNLYSAVATNNLPVNVSLIGSTEGTVRGSLVVNATDTQITFVATTLVNSTGLPIAGVSSPGATCGILAPDGYTVVLDSTSTSFVTTNGQLLDGTDSGSGGTNFQQLTAVDNSADVDVVIPSFARGPSSASITSTVNVLNASTPIFVATPLSISSSAKNGATESGSTVTIITTAAHGLVAGQTVTIAGVGNSDYDGTFTVASVPTATTFTYVDSAYSSQGSSGGGTVTGYGLTESGQTVTVWTTVAHDLAANEPVTISGAAVSGYNGTFTVTSLRGGANSRSFTYTDTNTELANCGGGTASLARGIPISLSGPTGGVTSGQFTLTYSSSDLSIGGALVDPSLAASYGATMSLDASSTPGNAVIDFSTTTPLPSASGAPILLGGLMATVPSGAFYKAKDLLHFSSVSLQAGANSVAAIGTDALDLVAFPGDASGTGAITSGDALGVARVVAGADTGFAAYQLTDPDIIADLLGDGTVDGPDGATLGRYINGATVPQIPVYPGAPANKLSGADPTVSIPSTLQLEADGSVTAPVNIDDPAPAESTGLTQATLALTYDRAVRSVSASDIRLGSVPAGAAGVLRHAADGLFAALGGGAADAAGLGIAGSGADPDVGEGLAAARSAAGSAQANLDRLLWENGDSSWQDGKREWLPE
jgi:hypothetical protein